MITKEELKTLPEGDQLTPGTRLWYGVHMSHCCERHGCKYCDEDCPVANKKAHGVRCEDCDHDDEENDRILRAYWEEYYAKGPVGCCTLCGNTGFVDTTDTANMPNGTRCGKKQYCFCPNGRSLRAKK